MELSDVLLPVGSLDCELELGLVLAVLEPYVEPDWPELLLVPKSELEFVLDGLVLAAVVSLVFELLP